MSKASRRRMVESLAQVADYFEDGFVVTLTYGKDAPTAWESKKHLDTLGKRWVRRFPELAFFWMLEAQVRGAPHYHLLVPLVEGLDEWFRSTWIDITGYGGSDPVWRNRKAVKVQKLRGYGGFMGYLAKEFGKQAQKEFVSGESPGNWWGFINRYVEGSRTVERFDRVEAEMLQGEELLARLAAINDLWDTWGEYTDLVTGETVVVMRTFWAGDVAEWIATGEGSPRGPPL